MTYDVELLPRVVKVVKMSTKDQAIIAKINFSPNGHGC